MVVVLVMVRWVEGKRQAAIRWEAVARSGSFCRDLAWREGE